MPLLRKVKRKCRSKFAEVLHPLPDEVLRALVRQNPQWMDDSDVATGTKFPSLMYRTSISFPFAGIGGPERAMIESNWPFIAKKRH